MCAQARVCQSSHRTIVSLDSLTTASNPDSGVFSITARQIQNGNLDLRLIWLHEISQSMVQPCTVLTLLLIAIVLGKLSMLFTRLAIVFTAPLQLQQQSLVCLIAVAHAVLARTKHSSCKTISSVSQRVHESAKSTVHRIHQAGVYILNEDLTIILANYIFFLSQNFFCKTEMEELYIRCIHRLKLKVVYHHYKVFSMLSVNHSMYQLQTTQYWQCCVSAIHIENI